MSASATAEGPPAWVLVSGLLFTAVVLGLGVWVSVATGQWLAVVLAIGLCAPVDVLLVRRHSRRTV